MSESDENESQSSETSFCSRCGAEKGLYDGSSLSEHALSISAYKQMNLSGIKYIIWNERRTPIFTQVENGPCPLIAVINALSLQDRLEFNLNEKQEFIDLDILINVLGDYLLNIKPDIDENLRADYDENLKEALDCIYSTKRGVNLNVSFSDVNKIECSPELLLLDILNLNLYHGWVLDPTNESLFSVAGKLSYNQAIDLMLTSKDDNKCTEEEKKQYSLITEFMAKFPTQLSDYGLQKLSQVIKDTEIAILFRNNHFSTVIQRDGELFTLVTDHGYSDKPDVVWEYVTLSGSGDFLTANLEPSLKRYPSAENSSSSYVTFNYEEPTQEEIDQQKAILESIKEGDFSKIPDYTNPDRKDESCHLL